MQTERLLPEAFRHLAAGREPHASAAERLLAAASERFGPPLVVPATARSLSAIKQSRGRVAVLTWSARYLSGDAPTDARLTPSMVRSWIAAATPMLGDKDRALRNAAVDAFVALDAADPEAIPAFIEMYAAPRERAALLSHLLPACPTIETNLRVFQSRQGMPAHLWPAQGGGAGVGPSSATAQLDRVLSGSVGSAETSPTQHGWTPGLTESNSDTVRGGSPAASPALRAPRAAAEAERAHEERVAGGSQYAQNNSAPHGAGGGYSPISYTPVREADIQDEGVAEGHFQKAIAVLASPARPQGLPLLHQLLFLAELAKMAPSKLWQRYLPQVFSLLRPLLSAPHPADVREHAAVALRDVAVWQPRAAAPLLGTLLPDLLSAAAAEPAAAGEVAGLADEALEAVCGKQDPGACMAVVLRCLPPQGGSPAAEFPSAVLKAGVRCIGRLSKRLHPEQLLEFARQGMMPLTVAASSPSADLRKAAVFAMVDMWVTAGDVLGPLLASHLTDSQLKLVTIYVNKARERQRVQQQA
ncbi:unnamed protein product [Pedinophyceae sp. YPF-701]|nr:unnamed protein product [Pedinophyceae sp. YPF-701]